jgi:hypothetical protein
MVLRYFEPGDQLVLLDLVNDAYGSVETLVEDRSKQLLCWKNKVYDHYEH